MTVPCEVATKSVVPALRALIAEQLIHKLNLKQDEVANILGTSQSAISKYNRKVRGRAIDIKTLRNVQPQISKIVRLIADGTYDRETFLKMFCEVCTTVRRSGLMCPLCQKVDESLRNQECRACLS